MTAAGRRRALTRPRKWSSQRGARAWRGRRRGAHGDRAAVPAEGPRGGERGGVGVEEGRGGEQNGRTTSHLAGRDGPVVQYSALVPVLYCTLPIIYSDGGLLSGGLYLVTV